MSIANALFRRDHLARPSSLFLRPAVSPIQAEGAVTDRRARRTRPGNAEDRGRRTPPIPPPPQRRHHPDPDVDPDHGQEAELRRALRACLLALPYRAFVQIIARLLSAHGYTRVVPSGRDHWKGRNQNGGWDLELEIATRRAGSTANNTDLGPSLRAIAQVKQFDGQTVHQRSVDALRGACLRSGAQHALLITLSVASPVARQAALADERIAPVWLIEGNALLDHLLANHIGVAGVAQTHRTAATPNVANRVLDTAFFDDLAERFAPTTEPVREGAFGTGQTARTKIVSPPVPPTMSPFVVTITLGAARRPDDPEHGSASDQQRSTRTR